MSLTLRRWESEGRSARLYVNGYTTTGKVWIEEGGDSGVAVRATRDAGKVEADTLLSILRDAFSLVEASWGELSKAAELAPDRQERLTAKATKVAARPQWSAMDTALMAIAHRHLATRRPVIMRVAPGQPDEVCAALTKVGNLTLIREAPPWGDLALDDGPSFLRLTVESLSGRKATIPSAGPPGSRGFAFLEGELRTPSSENHASAITEGLVRLSLVASIVPSMSPAHTGHLAAALVHALVAAEGDTV